MSEIIYYALIDKVEEDRLLNIYFEFHCIEEYFGRTVLDLSQKMFEEQILREKDQVIILSQESQKIYSIFNVEFLLETESIWVTLFTNDKKVGLEASLFIDGNQEERQIYISSIIPMAPNDVTRIKLQNKVSLKAHKSASKNEIKKLLEQNKNNAAEFISVYNVGQGNCNAVCNNEGTPLLYFDLGGGCYKNRHTYSVPLKFCFRYKPPIVLSHWDLDHFQSAKLNPVSLSQNWIVPRQIISTVYLKFFLSISGKRLIWPKGVSSICFNWGEVFLCTGPKMKKNHCGLAFSANLNPSTNKIANVLLPADAAYKFIPCVTTTKYEGLIATHHGANFETANSPLPTGKGVQALSYSFGSGNSFGHPKGTALTSHDLAGWSTLASKETIGGHIAMIDCLPLPSLPCRGTCNLQTIQSF